MIKNEKIHKGVWSYRDIPLNKTRERQGLSSQNWGDIVQKRHGHVSHPVLWVNEYFGLLAENMPSLNELEVEKRILKNHGPNLIMDTP